jgi:hypothetical protein
MFRRLVAALVCSSHIATICLTYKNLLRSRVLTSEIMKNTILWDTAQSTLLIVNNASKENIAYILTFKNKPWRKQRECRRKTKFHTEDWDNIFLKSIVRLSKWNYVWEDINITKFFYRPEHVSDYRICLWVWNGRILLRWIYIQLTWSSQNKWTCAHVKQTFHTTLRLSLLTTSGL